MDDFVVTILTYNRPNKVITLKTLRKAGYTGKVYLICSKDDKALKEYINIYGSDVLVFDKEEYKGKFDIGDNFNDLRVVVYARNAVFDLMKQKKVKYFLVLDDDYTNFNFRFDENYNYSQVGTIKRNLDKIFKLIFNYYKTISALSITLSQGGDFIGGKESERSQSICIKRKIMNSFFCSTDRVFKFIGRINEDVNTYVTLGLSGELVFQINQIALEQLPTQNNTGGLTEFYLDIGTYVKSFYTVMFAPSCTTIGLMGNKFKRLHHFIDWNNCVSKIINERYKKNE